MKLIKLDITKEDITSALKKAKTQSFLDNLRERNQFVKLDSKIRGYLGEICIKRWFNENEIEFQDTKFEDVDGNIDIDLLFKNSFSEEIIIEIKTSLIPDNWKNIEKTMQRADIKIIKRTEKSVENVHADFHVQIYFNFLRKERDSFLKTISGNINNYNDEDLIKIMNLNNYEQLFVSWVDKKSLIKYINSVEDKTWSFGFRNFWKCPINEIGNEPFDIIKALKNYKVDS